jgi:proteic killer suppression protein
MQVRHAIRTLERLESDPAFDAGFPADVVSAYRRRMQFIRSAVDERAFYAMKSLHFEKLKGDRSHQRSMRLNAQWRLVLELERGAAGTIVVIVSVEDYH